MKRIYLLLLCIIILLAACGTPNEYSVKYTVSKGSVETGTTTVYEYKMIKDELERMEIRDEYKGLRNSRIKCLYSYTILEDDCRCELSSDFDENSIEYCIQNVVPKRENAISIDELENRIDEQLLSRIDDSWNIAAFDLEDDRECTILKKGDELHSICYLNGTLATYYKSDFGIEERFEIDSYDVNGDLQEKIDEFLHNTTETEE